MQTAPSKTFEYDDDGNIFMDWESEHARLHAVVEHLEAQKYLSDEEQMKLKNVKKMKLRAKDRLQMLGRSF